MRRKSRPVKVGSLTMGGDNPVVIQTMWDKALTPDLEEEKKALSRMAAMGCSLVRFAAPNQKSAEHLGRLAQETDIPLVADIHFDYRIALRCMDFPIAKIRINPGNIGEAWKTEEVIRKAADKGIPLRVGANEGSLPKELRGAENRAAAMVQAAEEQLDILEKLNFDQAVVSLKSSNVEICRTANRLFAEKYDYPLHLGVTEAGPLIPSLVKSTLALGDLLREGIGDTIRISISDSPYKEIMACRELLANLGLGTVPHVNLVSCPKCGRTTFDTHKFAEEIETSLYSIDKNLTIAVMGCVVNGPGEAQHADLGITGMGDQIALFHKGEIIRRAPLCQANEVFWEELEKLR
ncbi:MAG: flavodoxin-dependent (E)-4-hydroxy-3-methylbut-2-enyl-diphosphate synthase [Spirochaetales bacterium]|nr:flavodoxin-dependent (E)-4-hydroxy-3-methylbut-2-enyl-diphosphate synthase [Spirochaetales bacterium]